MTSDNMKLDEMEIKCKCGGKLIKSQCEVEFFGIDFGIKNCEICRECGAEYLDSDVMQTIEDEVKKRGAILSNNL